MIEFQKGQSTEDIFSTVSERAKHQLMHARDLTSILSGHVEFNIHLHRMNKRGNQNCQVSSAEDTPAQSTSKNEGHWLIQ